jgi:hypothetical protein
MGIDIEGAVSSAGLVSPPTDEQQVSFLANGGQVVWVSGLTFRVSAATYFIGATEYNSLEQTITLDAADATDDRIDVIALDTTGTVVKVTGTPGTPAGEPSIDPETQLKLIIVTVPEDATAPIVSNTSIYAEGAEWTDTTSGSGWTLDSTNNPRGGTKCEEATSVAANAYIQWATTTVVDLSTKQQLVFYIRSKATWPAAKMLRVRFQLSGVLKGVEVTLRDGYWGFDSSITSAYQQIAIPLTQFQSPVSINQLRMTVVGSGGSIGFYLDDIFLQTGTVQEIAVNDPVLTAGEFISDGLVAGYKFDQGSGQILTDYGPNALHGFLGTDATAEATDPTWVSPRGLLFDGAGDRVTIPTPNTAMRLTTGLSVECSFKHANNGGLWDKTGAGVTNENYNLQVGTPTTTFRLVKANATLDNAQTTTYMVGGKFHVVCTWDGALSRIYLNGVELGNLTSMGQLSVVSPIDDVDGVFLIGHFGSAVLPWGGTIYKLAIYNRALNPGEVAQSYAKSGLF